MVRYPNYFVRLRAVNPRSLRSPAPLRAGTPNPLAACDPVASGDPLAADLVAAVRALVRVARHLEHVSTDLSLPHYRVLSAIARGSQRASRIAEALALGKPTISAAVDALEQRGLLVRRTLAGDQRVATLELTAEGHGALARAEDALSGRLGELCRRTGDGAQLARCLGALGPALDAVLAERQAGSRP